MLATLWRRPVAGLRLLSATRPLCVAASSKQPVVRAVRKRRGLVREGDPAEVVGTVTRVLYADRERGFALFRLATGEVVGTGDMRDKLILEGLRVSVSGKWTNHLTHGLRITADSLEVLLPETDPCTLYVKWLALRVPNVGPVRAQQIIDHFGADLEDALHNHPHEVAAVVAGKNPTTLAAMTEYIKTAASEWHEVDVVKKLQTMGMDTHMAFRLRTHRHVLEKAKQNPYNFLEVRGIRFDDVDHFALNVRKLPKNSPDRIAAYLQQLVLKGAVRRGHIALSLRQVVTSTAKRLDMDERSLEEAILSLAKRPEHHVVIAEMGLHAAKFVYPEAYWQAEGDVAARVMQLAEGDSYFRKRLVAGQDMDVAVKEWIAAQEKHMGDDKFSESQKKALAMAFTNKFSIITGGPGVGKTTIVKALVDQAKEMGLSVALCAPTGRAAKRLGQVTGVEGCTIHRLLKMYGKQQQDVEDCGPQVDDLHEAWDTNPLDELRPLQANPDSQVVSNLLVMDETSMCDVRLMAALLNTLPPDTQVVLVGDSDQLPSIAPGMVLRDLIDSQQVAVTRLREVHRQAQGSHIIQTAHNVNTGTPPRSDCSQINWKGALTDSKDFQFVATTSDDTAMDIVRGIVQHHQSKGQTVQLLTATKVSPLGSVSLNTVFQPILNPRPEKEHPIPCGRYDVYVGDRVMQTVNDYKRGVFNGDVGTVTHADPPSRTVKVQYQEKEVTYAGEDYQQLVLAYAATVHKSQGCEYDVVVLPVSYSTRYMKMADRRLLYTAVTRSKQRLYIVGCEGSVREIVARDHVRRRISFLAPRLNHRLLDLAAAEYLVEEEDWLDLGSTSEED